jgi:hypothetical protein
MSAKPTKLPVIKREEPEEGKTNITVEYPAPTLVRLFSSRKTFRKTYSLDKFGVEVYDACDGKTTVKKLVRNFAADHDLSQAEAEMSVGTFLKTLITRGLIAMELDRNKL